MTTLDFYFDYSCPYAYLGSTQIEHLAERMSAKLTLKPMLLGGVFRARGTPQNLMNVLSPAKALHNSKDMMRWAELFGAPLAIPQAHPMRTVEALRATLLTGCDPKVIHGFYRAYWVDGKQVSDLATIESVLTMAGHSFAEIRANLDGEFVKDDLRVRTDEAIQLGIFGAPTYVVDGKDLYWGQDRTHLVSGEPFETHYFRQPKKSSTMKHKLDVYFDFVSPFAYLGCTQAQHVAERTSSTLEWKPMLLGGLFRTIGQVDFPMSTFSEAKQKHYMEDMMRWARYWNVPFRWPSKFPVSSVKALRTFLTLDAERRDVFREKVFHAMWADDLDISQDAVLLPLIGQDGEEVLARTQDAAVKQELIERTSRAAAAGVFGAPTWVVDEKELFWGQDRLPLVERALTS